MDQFNVEFISNVEFDNKLVVKKKKYNLLCAIHFLRRMRLSFRGQEIIKFKSSKKNAYELGRNSIKSVQMSHHGHKRYEFIFNLGYKLLSPLVQ